MRRRLAPALFVAMAAAVGLIAPGAAAAPVHRASATTSSLGSIRVSGDVSTPATYSASQLRDLPQVTLPDTRTGFGGTTTGVSLQSLVTAAAPTLPAGAKNGQLRVLVTVSGVLGTRTVSLGELDSGFGNHPALLALRESFGSFSIPLPGGPYLALPGDDDLARTVIAVREVKVSVVSPASPATAAGDLAVAAGRCSTTVSAARIAALPKTDLTVSFLASGAPQTHTESGPALAAVLRAARVPVGPNTAVATVATDGYVSTVTPAEATSGRRPLLISTTEDGAALERPRLVPAGDVKGGRYNSNVTGLTVYGSPGCS